MKTSANGIKLIGEFEGYRDTAYECPKSKSLPIGQKFWTIGYGTAYTYPDTKLPIKQGDKCTMEQAIKWKSLSLARFEKAVMAYNAIYNWNQNQFDALVSFAYNAGEGNLAKLVANGTRTLQIIADKMLEYINKGTIFENGLRKRRGIERELFLRPVSGNTNTDQNQVADTNTNPYKYSTTIVTSVAIASLKGIKSFISNGNAVKAVQWDLKRKGYDLGRWGIDGNCGNQTVKQIEKFQRDNKLLVDGLAGIKTFEALKK